MDWSNQRILEFIRNYKTEPLLWNPQDPNYKKKSLHYDAWLRIKANLGWDITVDELKRKMRTLMGYYRLHQNKYKKSLKSGEGTHEVYQTNWFAFSELHNFLAPVYEWPPFTPQVNEENEPQNKIDTEDSSIEERTKPSVRRKPRIESLPPEIIKAKKLMHKAFDHIKTLNDEYEMFGKLIAKKIRKLKDQNAREIVMKDIYNLIYKATLMDPLKKSTVPCPVPSPNPFTSNSSHYETNLSSPSSSPSRSSHEMYHKQKDHKSSRKRMKYR